MEEKILAFLEERSKGNFIKLNDFLKSLYPLPKPNNPPLWATQLEGKRLRILLATMQAKGNLTLRNNCHLKLGSAYYEGEQQVLKHHTLATTIIEAQK